MKIIPRIFQNIFRTKHQKQFEIIKRIAQMELFGGNSPMEGETKSFGAKDLRRFDKMKGRWVDADEYNQTHAGTPHAGQRQEVVAHKAKKETQANLQKEPTLSKYFVMKPDTKIIPIADLEQTHEPDVEKQGRAKKHMQNASIGIIPKRNPISVVDAGKKKHVIDGNSTLEVARTLGLQQIPATVLDTIDKGRLPQFLDAYKKLEEVAGGVQQANINQLKRAALKKVYGEWRKHKTQSYPELAGKRLFRGDGYDLIFNDDGELDIVKQNHSVERQQVKLWKEYDRPKELRNKVKENKGDEAVTELMALAEKHKANFENGLKAVCKIVGVEFNQEMFDNFGTKSHESMRRKIHSAEKEQKLALYGAQYVNDALRYTFEISKWDDVQGIYDQLIGNEKETGFKILDDTVDNKFANPTDEGYRDLSMVLRVNDEITAEVQINFKALNDAKLGEGHRMYEQLRELKQKALTERSSENVSQIRAQINSIVDKSRKFYESVLNSVIGGEQAVDYSVALRKSIGNWFLRFFKTQLDIFGAKPKPQAAGIKWDKKMQEKPNHKYIRRYKGKDGEWRYVYREGEREYVGDAKGKELPKHHDWQAGDKVTHGGQEAVVHELGDKHVVLRTADNQTKTVPVEQVEHYTETQKKLLGNRAQAVEKYQSLIDEYEEDLKQGEDTNKYEFADSRAELERKIKYTKEEKAKHEKEPKKSEQLSSGVTNDEYVFTEVTNLMQSGKFPNLQSAINDYWSSNQLKLANAGYSLKKLGEAVKHEMPADQTETPEFKEWFGSSKVVDENGKPLRVFHGTAADFEAFDKKKLGTATESSDSKTGFWFSEHAKRAELAAEDAEAVSDKGYGANIMPVFLQVNNPLVYDKQIPKTPEASAKIVKDAKAEGHDGVIFTRGEGGKNYVVFKPTQIKSAVGNTGEFSPKNPSIVAETLNPYGQASLFGDNPQPIKAPKTVKRIKIGKDELLMDEIFAPESGLITETSATDRDLVSVELKKSGTLKISGRKINSPEDVAYLCRRLADSAVEKFVIVPVDKNMKPMTIDVITIGLLNSSLVHPREALRTAVELGANGIIAVHNHPSGNATPSREDETVTSQIAAAAKYAGIVFHGHVVLGSQGKYTHMDESGTMNDQGTVSNATKVETTVPIYQKEIKRSGQKPEEANAPEDLIHISRRLTGGKTGVWLLTHDSTNKVVGAHQLRENVGDYDIKSYKKIIQGIVRNNAASASIYIAIPPEEKTGLQVAEATEKSIAKRKQMKEDLVEETARSYKDMFKVLGVQFLDVLAETIGVEKGTAYGFISAAERQMMRSVGSFIMNLFKAPTHGQTKQFGISDLRKFDANRHRWIDADEWRKLNPPKIEKPTGQENLFTPDKTVEMKANDYLEEHTKLIEVLKEGDPQKLKAEAADQSKEVKEQKEKLEKEKNNVSCVMVPLSDSDELKRIQKLIPNEDIYDDDTKKFGRESWYHVTVLFGIVSNDFEAVKKLLENHKPFSVKLANKTSVFNNDLYDVIKIDVNSEGLKRMNKKLWKEFKVKTDHPDYHPHLTIAYVKKGKGKEYDGLKVNPSKFQVEQITFSDYDRWKKDFPLIKKEKEQ
jgi:DNA repair protein RadC